MSTQTITQVGSAAITAAILNLTDQVNQLVSDADLSKIDAAIPLIQTQRIIAQIVLNQK